MESCNSRQGLLIKSYSTITANDDDAINVNIVNVDDDDEYRSPIINNNNVPKIYLDDYGSTNITNNGCITTTTSTMTTTTTSNGIAKFFIGDDGDENLLINQQQQQQLKQQQQQQQKLLTNSYSLTNDDDDDYDISDDDDDIMATTTTTTNPTTKTIKQSNTESTIIIMDQSPTPSQSSCSPISMSIDQYGMIMVKGNHSTKINNDVNDDNDNMIINDERLHFLTNWSNNNNNNNGFGRTDFSIINGGGGGVTTTLNNDKHFNNDVIDKKQNHNHHGIGSSWQIFMAVMIAASGNFIAGLILDNSKSWNVFIYTPELYYLVPILLSLKGNLEMTMVARLSTLANLGMLKSLNNIIKILLYNISLVQTQAIVVSFLASIVTLLALKMEGEENIDLPLSSSSSLPSSSLLIDEQQISSIIQNTTTMSTIEQLQNIHGDGTALTRKCLLIFSTSLATANIACLLSTVIMITLTVALHYCHVNPDNFVTALAASFGDIITSFLIGVIGEFINEKITYQPLDDNATLLFDSVRYNDDLQSPLIAILIIILFIAIFPLLAWFTCRDESNKKILLGMGAWLPILLSMLIAFVSGFVLRFGAVAFNFMSLFQPLINGVGGNLAAITTSRYSTELHKQKAKETIVNNIEQQERSTELSSITSSLKSVMSNTMHSFLRLNDNRNKLILLYILMAIVVHLFYGILAPIIHTTDHHRITWLFYIFYIPATILQVFLLLILTRFFVDFVWWLKCDPDTSAIPILTSMGDILGTVFLYCVFILLRLIGDQSSESPLYNNFDNNNEIIDQLSIATTTTTTTAMPTLYEFITSAATTTINDPITMINDNEIIKNNVTAFIRHIMMNQIETTTTAASAINLTI
uniref:Solute carrier family 41 member 2-like isoform X1 n=1 Tax=Dermatophagoides pteronyssinus TaxID=6956 RepID=A0A6P6YB41_DERPT|nr:solute carrier family 41 member 2-like isoform X1 [Dermatophagoides pteronyssinus]